MTEKQPRVAILVTDYFEEAEMVEPRKFLEEQGARTVLIAPKKDKVQALRHVDKAAIYPVDLALENARPEEFDVLLLPAGR